MNQPDTPRLTVRDVGANQADTVLLLRRLRKVLDEAAPEDLPALVAALSAAAASGAARLLKPQDKPRQKPDENLDVAEAASRLGVSKAWIYRNRQDLPFARRIGSRLLFSSKGLEAWNRAQKA